MKHLPLNSRRTRDQPRGLPTVLTIGHSTRTFDEFLRLLKTHGVTCVVDVRTVPRSRHNPQFNRDTLPVALKTAGIGYEHMTGLGGLRHARRDSVNTGWRNASFRGYADYMQTPEFEKSLQALIKLAKQKRVALMCAEAVPWRCHRSMIADALVVRGIQTEDIMSINRRQIHSLTSFAKVKGAHITYPPEGAVGDQPKLQKGRSLKKADCSTMSRNVFFLEPVSPFRLDLTVWTLRRRPDNVLDRWDGQNYRRVLPLQEGLVEIAVTQVGPPEIPRLRISVQGQPLRSNVKAAVTSALERLLGLRIDLAEFYRLAAREEPLGELAGRFQGMRPPRYATVFESVVVGIASQQVSRTVSILVLNRLTANYGPAVHAGEAIVHAFPRAEDLTGLRPSELRPLGFSRQKERAITELAQSVAGGSLDLEGLAQLPDEEAIKRLCSLRGVGRWTAEYVLLRGLGRTHIFPGDDVGARNNLKRWLGLEQPLDYEAVRRTLERWHPYAGLIYFHMLLDRLEEAGFLEETKLSPNCVNHTDKNANHEPEMIPMKKEFKAGDHVEWNSEAGRVRGTIKKKIVTATKFKTYTARASKEEPQYLIKSDKTDHLAMHKGAALKKIGKN